ncbi:MAG: hypothetical protein ACK5X3_13890 [Pseudomonadota bacterium]
MKPLTTNQKRAAAFSVAVAVVCGVAWVCGFNFNERGLLSGMVAVYAISAGTIAAIFSE